MDNAFETETHKKELDTIYGTRQAVLEQEYAIDTDCRQYGGFKTEWRFVRKQISAFLRRKRKRNFEVILFVTLSEPPFDFISAFRKQYPDKDIKVLVPIETKEEGEKLVFDFEFYLQNRMNNASLYKLKTNRENVEIFGLYSESFSGKDFSRLQYLAPFIKAARYSARKLKPDIVHADKIPLFLGAELEKNFRFPIKVLQIADDFAKYENDKKEAFWAAVNLVDETGMKKLCRDKIIKKCIAALFNLHNTKRFCQMRECLEFLYENYYKFRRYVDKCDDIDENILFNRMNARILKLFPQMTYEDDLYYNTMFYTLKRTDFWAVSSKTYYDNLFSDPNLSGKMFERISKTKDKSAYFLYGNSIADSEILQSFNSENFREERIKNKKYLIKEFSKDRIRTKFVDTKLLEINKCRIKGYLDSFYEAPLIFCRFSADIFPEGADIALTVILKLFELYKNIQVIINIPEGFNNNNIKNWVEFLEKNSDADGKWLFIDGEINTAQFYASSDMSFFPARSNMIVSGHYQAMKYGCIPIASRMGIYNDTIADIFDDMVSGCGFKAKPAGMTGEDAYENFLSIVSKALKLYTQNPASWNLLIKNAINYNSGWTFEKIEKFNAIYEELL